jgi:hypothetical protein
MFPYDNLYPLMEKGQEYLAEKIKLLVCHAESELFERLDFNDDSIFLEPFLFSYFTRKVKSPIGLHQLLFGYIEPLRRYDSIDVHADEAGIIYLPNIGYFYTDLRNENAALHYDRGTDQFQIKKNNNLVAFRFDPPLMIAGTSIEVYKHHHPFFHPYFAEWNEETKDFENFGAPVEITRTTEQHLDNLTQTFALLKRFSPEQIDQYAASTRRIVLFNNSKIRNFAVRDMHGMAFINGNSDDTVIYFLEEVIHQCSHNFFNAVTANLSDHFRIDAETPLKKYSHDEGEFRSIYSAHHGLYTVATRMACFDNCIDGLDGAELLEVVGRFADLRMRFRNGLDKLDYEEVFTPLGHHVYIMLDEFCSQIFDKRHYLIYKFDYTYQNAGFNFQKFAQLNSFEKMKALLDSGRKSEAALI